MDSKHAQELRELDKKGLCKMSLKGAGAHDVTVVVDKNVPNSIAYDFIQEELEVSIFLNSSTTCFPVSLKLSVLNSSIATLA